MPTTSLALRTAADMRHKIRRGLVAYWPLASAGAVDLKSYHGNPQSLTLTNNNGVTRTAGPSSNLPDAAQFTRTSTQFLSLNDNNVVGVQTGNQNPFSFTCWIYLDSAMTGDGVILGKDNLNTREYILNYTSASALLTFATFTGVATTVATVNSATTVTTATWYFVTCTFSAARQTIQINNGAIAADTSVDGGTITRTSTAFEIGARVWSGEQDYWDGRIAQVCLWKRVLTVSEHDWLYNNGQGRDLRRLT